MENGIFTGAVFCFICVIGPHNFDYLMIVLFLLSAVCTICWMIFLARAAYHGGSVSNLKDMQKDALNDLPLLSIIVAARNEIETIRHSLPTLLTASKHAEVIVVDDRSTDGTSEVIDQEVAKAQHAKAIHLTELPNGWLGKVNALNEGMKHASGDWLLFTDADIHFKDDVLERAVAYCEREKVDHLMLIPESDIESSSVWLPLFNVCFGILFLQTIKAKEIGLHSSDAYGGVGAFNLVRRSTFEQTEGFEWLKLEILDDVGIGLLIKKAKGKSAILNATDLLSFEWYPTVRGMIKGLEKNSFAGFAHLSFKRAIRFATVMLMLALFPLMLALVTLNVPALIIALSTYVIIPGIAGFIYRKQSGFPPLIMTLLPIGFVLLMYALLNSTYKAWKNNGIYWRETFYPLDELRKAQRVKLRP